MEVFTVLFYTGIIGIVASFVLGFARIGRHRGSSRHHHSSIGNRHSPHSLSAKHSASGALHHPPGQLSSHHVNAAHAGHVTADRTQPQTGSTIAPPSPSAWQTFFIIGFGIVSPLNVFAFCLAVGGIGLILAPHVGSTLLWSLAILAGLIFTFGVIGPIMNFLMKFESTPSLGLQGTQASQVTAISSFDQNGKGLVIVELDGQLRQVLATLESDEVKKNVKVSKGDQLFITSVDEKKNAVKVSKELG